MAQHHAARREPRVGRTPGWTPLHETGATILSTDAGTDVDAASETGTTIVGLTTDDAVVLAADRRASLGGRFVTNKRVRKVDPVHPTAAAALSGVVGGIQAFVRTLRAETTLYRDRRGEEMSVGDALGLALDEAGKNPRSAAEPVAAGPAPSGRLLAALADEVV